MTEQRRCTCDDFCDSPCPVHSEVSDSDVNQLIATLIDKQVLVTLTDTWFCGKLVSISTRYYVLESRDPHYKSPVVVSRAAVTSIGAYEIR